MLPEGHRSLLGQLLDGRPPWLLRRWLPKKKHLSGRRSKDVRRSRQGLGLCRVASIKDGGSSWLWRKLKTSATQAFFFKPRRRPMARCCRNGRNQHSDQGK